MNRKGSTSILNFKRGPNLKYLLLKCKIGPHDPFGKEMPKFPICHDGQIRCSIQMANKLKFLMQG